MDKNFIDWYKKTEEETGSLVTPASAAKMIGISRQYLEKIILAGRIKKYYYKDIPFIGMNDINKEYERRKEKIQKENEKETILFKSREEELLAQIEQLKREKEEIIRQQEFKEFAKNNPDQVEWIEDETGAYIPVRKYETNTTELNEE